MKWILLSTMVGSTVIGDLLQSSQMKQQGEVTSGASLGAALVRNRLLILSIGCMAVSFFALLALGQVAELSFVVPASAASVVLETILARLILGEHVNRNRWLGVLCVACGVYLLAA